MKFIKQIISSNNKALRINLNPNIYGTFAEIGAGQETVRLFFRAGASSQTIAKAISAYDKNFSDSIYGKEKDGRYVTEHRLYKMLKHEIHLIEKRLHQNKYPERLFFSYANTVQTIDFTKKNKGHGWMGIHFQMKSMEDYNEIILHLRFFENDTRLQQESIGILGVNLIYGAFYYGDNTKILIKSLYDELRKDQIEIDMINFRGPRFNNIDNRLMSLQLLKEGMTNAIIFKPPGRNVLPSELLYNKNILVMRGSFRPVTNVNIDMLISGMKMFLREVDISKENTQIIFEITLSNFITLGKINKKDFLDRTDILGKLGYIVMISNYSEYYKLINFFMRVTKKKIAIIMGVNNLLEVFNEKFYKNLSGGIMEAFGKLFSKNMKIFLYPYIEKDTGKLLNSKNLKVNINLKELYKYLRYNNKIIDVEILHKKNLLIYPKEILSKIYLGEKGWESKVPKVVAEMIKNRGMFNYSKMIK